jgi:uncharacterized DUF497 family protein
MPGDDALPFAASEFEWDEGNAAKNWTKHGVTQRECEEIFFRNPLIAGDPAHSLSEPRWFALGLTAADRPLTIIFTVRGNRIRVVSARPMSRREREILNNAKS